MSHACPLPSSPAPHSHVLLAHLPSVAVVLVCKRPTGTLCMTPLTVQARVMAVRIPLYNADGEQHSYVLSYRSGIQAAASGLSIHQGWFSGVGSGTMQLTCLIDGHGADYGFGATWCKRVDWAECARLLQSILGPAELRCGWGHRHRLRQLCGSGHDVRHSALWAGARRG